jgi:MoaA/NifB/PqqE/SkfB family radical SAM enzyme
MIRRQMLRRTLDTALAVWRRRGLAWPFKVSAGAFQNRLRGLPRGLMVEPTEACTGRCAGCPQPLHPACLTPERLAEWLDCRGAHPVTVHFSGKHSDPVASVQLPSLARVARSRSCMVSVSTIGLGLQEETYGIPFDRWIVSIPGATAKSWLALRGNHRFHELKTTLKRLSAARRSMVELVLTVWKPSAGDTDHLGKLAEETGIRHIKTVFGRYDPSGHHLGSVENLPLDEESCPYILTAMGQVELKRPPRGCPLSGTVFLDASGVLHPCPFCSEEEPAVSVPSREAWRMASSWEKDKGKRPYLPCRWCPS